MRGLVVALSVAVAGGVAGPAMAAKAQAMPAWLTWRTTVPASDVETTYQALLREKFTRDAGGDSERLGDRLASATDFAFSPRDASFQIAEGAQRGDWTFYRRATDRWPIAVLHWRLDDPTRYAVVVDVRCRHRGAECNQAKADAAALARRAPQPTGKASPEVLSAWRDIVIHEACEPGDVFTPAPRYPPEEQRRGIAGSVTLLVLINACGESRGASVEKSSGNRNLDRSAMQVSRRWHLMKSPTGVGGDVRVPVNFEISMAPAAPVATPPPAPTKTH